MGVVPAQSLPDGCNVLLPPNGQPGGCRRRCRRSGVDPSDNEPGSGAVNDNSSSTPLVAPDGTIYYGAYSRYNYSQGHLMHFSPAGEFLGSYPFGWDVTPALWKHGDGFSVITKENRYEGVGSYCNDTASCPSVRIPGQEQGYFVTQLCTDLGRRVAFPGHEYAQLRAQRRRLDSLCRRPTARASNGVSTRRPSTSAASSTSNSEDGFLYAIDQGGTLRETFFLQLALGAAYTPLSIGADGRIYTQNAGHLFAVGATGAGACGG